MLDVAIPILAPIFLIIALGWVLQTRQFFPSDFYSGLNALTFYVGLPALLLVEIATSAPEIGPALRITLVLLAATTAVTAVAYPAAMVFKLGGPGTGAFVQAAMRGNLAYIGLPVMFYAMGRTADSPDAAGIEATAMLVLAPTVVVYNLACVVVLTHSAGATRGRPPVLAVATRTLGNPLLIASLLGLLLAVTGIGLPATLVRTLRPLGQMALPLALLSLGASFTRGGLRSRLAPALGAAILKVMVAPLLGLLFAWWFLLSSRETSVALFFLACPTAVTSYIMAEQMGADAELAGSAVVFSTVLCIVPLAAILLFGGWLP